MFLSRGSEVQAEVGSNYHAAWKAFAMRRNLSFFLLFGWIPFCVALFYLSRYRLHQPILFMFLMGAWLVAALASVWWAGEFRCPRCRRRYGALGHKKTMNVTRGLFDKVCANCKLTKFEHPNS